MATIHSLITRGRRGLAFPLTLVSAVVIAVFLTPWSALWHQQEAINQTASQISTLQHQESVLSQEATKVATKASEVALAREQYQLVEPGQSLIQILPAVSQNPYANDPGNQPLASPTSGATYAPSATSSSTSTGFLSRVLKTLEFWR